MFHDHSQWLYYGYTLVVEFNQQLWAWRKQVQQYKDLISEFEVQKQIQYCNVFLNGYSMAKIIRSDGANRMP